MLKNLKTNILLLLSSLLIIFLILYLSTFLYFKYVRGYNKIEPIQYKEEINFIEKYSKKLHHIRHYTNTFYRKDGKLSDLLFSVEQNHKKENDKNNVSFLFLGDSWFEQLISYMSSRALINDFFNKKNINYINAATSSYSPILMNLQYKILRDDFKIKPDYVVIHIDQTDFGDELCRYKKNRYYNLNTNELIGVKPDLIKIPKIIELSRISSLNTSNIVKEIKIFNFFINLKLKIIKNNILKKIGKDQRAYGCKLDEIFSYLNSPSKEDLKYFDKSIENLFSSLNSSKNIKKIFIVTFPHRNQINKIKNFNNTPDYNVNISDLIDSYIEKYYNNKLQHINFTKLINSNEIELTENNFIENDQASHLNEKTHSNVFTKQIIIEIEKIIK